MHKNEGRKRIYRNYCRKNDSRVKIKTEDYGIVTINNSKIDEIKEIKQKEMVTGEYLPEELQSARYLFAPNGYGMNNPEGYYQNIWVLGNQISLAFSKYFTIGAGIIPTFLFGEEQTPVWLTPKFSFPVVKDKFNIGAGALLGGRTFGDFFSMPYAVCTLGNKDKNLTIGTGLIHTSYGWVSFPVINVSGMARATKRGYAIFETYYISFQTDGGAGEFLFMGGGRFIWSKISLEYGLVLPFFKGSIDVVVPWLGFSLPFNLDKKKLP